MSDYPNYGAMSYLREIFKANPPRYGPRPVMDTYTRPAATHYSTGMKAAPAEENWFSKAFKFPYVGHSLEMDELTKNHWEYKRDLNMWPGPVLFGRPSYGGRGVSNSQFLVQRDGEAQTGGRNILCDCFASVILVLIFLSLGVWFRRRRSMRRKVEEQQQLQQRNRDIERAQFGL